MEGNVVVVVAWCSIISVVSCSVVVVTIVVVAQCNVISVVLCNVV